MRTFYKGPDNYCDGRMVGYRHVFPRVPLVFRPKRKERKYDESEFKPENLNYASAREHSQQIEIQFQEEEKLGFMFPLTEKEARRRYGDRLRIASLGAIPKDDEPVRVIFDATHFVQIDNEITIQDRLEFPGPEASATVMEEPWQSGHRLMIAVAAGGRHRLGTPALQTSRRGCGAPWMPSGGRRTGMVQ